METKRCSMCGEIKDVGLFSRDKAKMDGLKCNCKDCQKQTNIEWRLKNIDERREREKEASAEYKKNNILKVRRNQERWRDGNRDIINKYLRKYNNNRIQNLLDSYICNELKKRGITTITPEIIELKREQLTIHRLLKEAKNGITGNGNKGTQADEQADNGRDD